MCVLNICVVDTDAASYDGIHPNKILSQHKRCKKGKYIEACLDKQHHFAPFVFSVYGVMWEDTKAENKQLGAALITKWDRE